MTKARVNADNASADIQGVTAGTGLSGGGTSGTVTLTNDMATVIDAKGDLVVGTGADTYDNLAVGNNGETLVADSSTSTGLRYQSSMAAGRNTCINGGFDIWQRGTSTALTTVTNNFVTDRFYAYRGGLVTGGTVSRQATNDSTNLPFIQYCARVQRDSGNTSTAAMAFVSDFESVNSIPYAGKTVTLSFYARSGANYSAASGALGVSLYSGTGTDQRIASGYTGAATPINQTATLTTTWQRFSYSATVSATATQLGVYFLNTPVGTAGAADYYEITGIQLEVGVVPTQFTRTGGTIQGELAACQRYFYQFPTGSSFGTGFAISSTLARAVFRFPVPMRVSPTLSLSATGFSIMQFIIGDGAISGTSAAGVDWGREAAVIQIGVASGLTALQPLNAISSNGLSSFSAEL
jgi:hypothetical protein